MLSSSLSEHVQIESLYASMHDDDGFPTFAFQDLDYIPSGFSGTLAPYIETSSGTMRAAAALMHLGLDVKALEEDIVKTTICDLGCGDGYFLMNLITHINTLNSNNKNRNRKSTTHGIGIDYDAALIKSASTQSDLLQDVDVEWLIYDFNDDQNDLVEQLIAVHQITHIFIYLVPRQLALPTVRHILTRLYESGVVLCCHKFFPQYLTPVRSDVLMDLVVYDIAKL